MCVRKGAIKVLVSFLRRFAWIYFRDTIVLYTHTDTPLYMILPSDRCIIIFLIVMTTSWTYILHWHTHVSDNVPTKRVKRDVFVRLPPLPRVDTPIHLSNIPPKKHLLRRNEKPKKIQHIPSVAVAVPTHNRIGYVQLASKAFSGTFPSKDVWLFDDKSTEYTPKELMRWYETKHIFSPEKQLKADAMARHILEWFVDTDYDVLVLLDSDLIVAPNWLDSLHAGLRDSIGVLSLYRSGAPKHKSSSCGAVLCEQPSMGNAGTVWRRELAEKMLSEMSNREGGFDWGWSEWCEKNKVPMQALKASAVLHIGMHGSWSHETTAEKSVGFPMSMLSSDTRKQAEVFLKGAKPIVINNIAKESVHSNWQSYITSTEHSQTDIKTAAYDSRNIWAEPDTCKHASGTPERPSKLFEKWSVQICSKYPKACTIFRKAFVDTWDNGITWLKDGTVFLVTGDIPLMWLRDSSAQVTHYLALSEHSSIQRLIEGVLRRQMKWIELDVYGSAFRMFLDFDHAGKKRLTDWDFKCGRTIHVAQHDYEMDSLAYVVRLAYQYWKKTGRTCWMQNVQKTWHRIVDMWIVEQDHSKSTYTYPTLDNGGKGTPVCKTGMSWAGMRPSDDKMKYHYNIPGQLFAAKALEYIEEMSSLWSDDTLKRKASNLRLEMLDGVKKYGVVDGVLAYETDGCGHHLMADDANIPSLLSLPYLDIHRPEYEKTRVDILSSKNPWWSEGGIGSPHTNGRGHPWHLAMIMEGWDDKSTLERVLKTTYGDTLHESVTMSGGSTRKWFGWANALFSEWLMSQARTAELSVITVTSPRPSHPDITIINQTLHAMYYHNPTWIKYPHYVLMDGCPKEKKYWEHKWCTGYNEFVFRLKREIDSRSYFKNVHIVEPSSWTTRVGLTGTIQHGFKTVGFAPTDVVYIQQDDTRFVNKKFDLTEILRLTHQLEPPYVRFFMRGEENGRSTKGYRPDECTFSDHPHFVEARMYYNNIFPKLIEHPGSSPEFLMGRGQLSSQKPCPHMCCGQAVVEHIDGMEHYKGTWAERPRDWIHDYPMSLKKSLKHNIKIWTCGWQTKPLYGYALSELPFGGEFTGTSSSEDVLLYDWGPCAVPVHSFKGRVFWFDGENELGRRQTDFKETDVYFGMPLDNHVFVQWSFLATAVIGMGIVDNIVHNLRPDTIGEEFLIYTQSNCVAHRERAFDAIARIQTPTVGGRCHGSITDYNKLTISHADWGTNFKEFKKYRFALVMENSAAEGYITEKMATAFVAGCIPIYYGHRDTANTWFNSEAFIFYDISNPQPALERIRELQNDDEAYKLMRSKPITLNKLLWNSLPSSLANAVKFSQYSNIEQRNTDKYMTPFYSHSIIKEKHHDEYSLSKEHRLEKFKHGPTLAGDALKHVLLNVLEHVSEIMQSCHTEYIVWGGTLLGALRHHGFIPWDNDVDILIKASSEKSLLSCIETRDEMPFTWIIRHGKHSDIIPIKVVDKNSGYYVDIFMCWEQADGTCEWRFSAPINYYPLKDLFPSKPCMFDPLVVTCPPKPRAVLERTYKSLDVPAKYAPVPTFSDVKWATTKIIQTSDLFAAIDYNAPENKGPWKQGWDYDYDGRFKDGLTVHVVPHSHNDPGWIQTYHTYYSTQTRHILDTVVAALAEDPRRTFIWAEISYFSLWWNDASPQQKEQAKRLVAEKRLDFVTGGWVMNDEASVTARATRWHLQEGREWLQKTFGITPQYSWAIDPFGHSAGQAQVLKELGYKGMLIQRVHYAVKKQLAQKQRLEFQWQTPAGEIFTHMMPFYSYDEPHTCGPDPSVCCQFDFARIGKGKTWTGCPWGKMSVPITEHNVAERSRTWLDQVYKKAMLYRGKHVLIPVGDDFRYQTMEEAHKQFTNYQKMFDWIETNVPAVKVSFSTLTRYFDAARETNVPKLQGSFFPYSDREKDYWTGYFNSRIFYKGYDRLLESLIAAVERKCPPVDIHLQKRAMGLFQHHDGITGTAKSHVVQDYYKTMQKAVESLHSKLKGCLSITESVLMNPLSIDTPTMKADDIRPLEEDKCVPKNILFEHIKLDEHGHLIQIDKTPIHESFVWRSNKPGPGVAGAYLMAVTDAKNTLTPIKHTMCVAKQYKQVETTFDMLKRSIRVYNDGTIEFIYDADIRARNNGELWAVYKPEWTAERLCSDVHGLTWECHTERKDAPLQAKFWPMPTMAWLASSSERLTFTGAQPTGVGFHEGAMVLMLDRRGNQDDARGLGQGVTDSRPVEMRFGVLMEKENLKEKASEKALVIRNWMLNPSIELV